MSLLLFLMGMQDWLRAMRKSSIAGVTQRLGYFSPKGGIGSGSWIQSITLRKGEQISNSAMSYKHMIWPLSPPVPSCHQTRRSLRSVTAREQR